MNKCSSQSISEQQTRVWGCFVLLCGWVFPQGFFSSPLCTSTHSSPLTSTGATAVQPSGAQGWPSRDLPRGTAAGTPHTPGTGTPPATAAPLANASTVNHQRETTVNTGIEAFTYWWVALLVLSYTEAAVVEFSQQPSDHGHGEALARMLR